MAATASRALHQRQCALRAAQSVRARILAIAAEMLEIDADKLVIGEGVVRAADLNLSNRSIACCACVPRHQCAAASNRSGLEPIAAGALLDANGKGDPIGASCSRRSAHEVEVDIEIGSVRVLSLAAAHDVGRAINPMVVEGQIEGSLSTRTLCLAGRGAPTRRTANLGPTSNIILSLRVPICLN